MEQNKDQHVNYLLEDGWFFGNSLQLRRSKSSKVMVRCNSDPCSSSSSKEETLVADHSSKMSNLLRTPSLPPDLEVAKYGVVKNDVEDEEEELSMGDLIMQAMPLPSATPKRLERTPSLPPCRGKEVVKHNLPEVGKLTRRISIDSTALLPEKGPLGMSKLTRRASLDSSMVLPPKYSSKSTRQSGSNSKNRPQRKPELPVIKEPTEPQIAPIQRLDKTKTQKSLSHLEIKELQAFRDLGFSSFDDIQAKPSIDHQVLPALQRRSSIDSRLFEREKAKRPSYLSNTWGRQSSPLSTFKQGEQTTSSAPSADDMKAQIKFWARAVASNVRQEC